MTAAGVDIPALKARHPLGDTVEASGVGLRGRGRVRQGVCPFHDEAEGSFTVYADSERFYCFGCGLGGDVLDFVQRAEGLTLPEAIRRLDGSPGPAPGAASRPAGTRRPRLLRSASPRPRPADGGRPVLRRAAAPPLRGTGVPGLPGRGPGRRSPPVPRLLAGRRAAAGPRVPRLPGEAHPGLGAVHGAGRERFAGMVVVPDVAGGLVRWLAGRALDPELRPRFQALPGPKPVLGLGRLGPAPPMAVVAEGLFDWLVLAGWGIPAVAALGAQGVERVASALRGCHRVFLAFDSDEAGSGGDGAAEDLLGRRAAAITLPRGIGDVGELASHASGRDLFLRLLERAARAAR